MGVGLNKKQKSGKKKKKKKEKNCVQKGCVWRSDFLCYRLKNFFVSKRRYQFDSREEFDN